MKIEEKKMTNDIHGKGSERSYSRRYEKKDAKQMARR